MSDVSVTFRHLEATPALKAYAEEKAAKINKYFGGLNEVNVVLSLEKHRYTAEITLKAGRTTVNAREETSDMYSAIDLVVDKINRQIKKYKDKMKDHKVSPRRQKDSRPRQHCILKGHRRQQAAGNNQDRAASLPNPCHWKRRSCSWGLRRTIFWYL